MSAKNMMTRTLRLGWAACLVGALAFAAGCGSDTDLVVDAGDNGNGNGDNGNGDNGNGNGNGDNGNGDNGNGDNGNGDNGNGNGDFTTCDGTTQCSDGIDNDGDGFIDMEDPHCASCFDDNEFGFATGIPGDNVGNTFQDCFFDGDSGSGNDGCRVPTCCYDPNQDVTHTGQPCSMELEVCQEGFSDQCLEICGSASPPGCDCIGCCTVCPTCPPGDADCNEADLADQCLDIWRGADFENEFSDCDPHDAENFNEENCPVCEKFDDCGGPDCEEEECVLCAGQTELPDHCDEEDRCPGGTACSNDGGCPDGQYCALGCCLERID